MTTRTVEVRLKLVTDQYKREAEEVKLKTEGLDRSVEGLDRDLKKLPPDAAKAAAAMKLLGTETMGAGNYIKGIGEKSTSLTVLDERIKTSQAEVRRLGEEFVRTGSVDVFGHLGRADGDLRALTDFRKRLVSIVGDAGDEGGKGFVRRFTNTLGGGSNSMVQGLANIPWAGIIFKPFAAAMSNMPPEVQIAIAGSIATAIVAGSAFIGAAINGVLLTGLGLGGLALGIVGQISNPMVHDAFARLGHDIKTQFSDITSSFTRPLAYSASIFEGAWQAIMPKLKADFEWLSKFIVPLASGFAGLFTDMMPGLDKGFAAAGPLLQQFANELPGLGTSLSHFFALLADGSKGAGEGLHALFLVAETLIVGIGGIIDGLSHLWQGFVSAGEAVSGFAANLLGWYPVLGGFLKSVHGWWDEIAGGGNNVADVFGKTVPTAMDAMGTVGGNAFYGLDQKMRDAASTLERINRAFDDAIGKVLDLDRANIAAAQGLADLVKGFKQGHDALDISIQKGRDNRLLIDNTVDGYRRQRDAAAAAAGGTQEAWDKANAVFRAQMANLENMLGKLLGSRDAAHAFMAEFVDKTVTINVKVKVTQTGSVSAQGVVAGGVPLHGAYAMGGVRRAADGLIVPPRSPGTILMGEPQTGGELLMPLRGISQSRAMGLAQVAGNAYGFNVSRGGEGGVREVRHVVDIMGGGDLIRRLVIVAAQNRGQSVSQYLNI